MDVFGTHRNTDREGLQARAIGNDKACVAFSVVKTTMLCSTPFLVPARSVAEVVFFDDRVVLFSVYLL